MQKGGKMAEYHVGCGLAGIYAGTLKKNGYDPEYVSDRVKSYMDDRLRKLVREMM